MQETVNSLDDKVNIRGLLANDNLVEGQVMGKVVKIMWN